MSFQGMKGAIDIGNDRVDLLIVQCRLPCRHGRTGHALPNHILQSRSGHARHRLGIGQIAGMRLEEVSDPVIRGAVGSVAKGAILLKEHLSLPLLGH